MNRSLDYGWGQVLRLGLRLGLRFEPRPGFWLELWLELGAELMSGPRLGLGAWAKVCIVA